MRPKTLRVILVLPSTILVAQTVKRLPSMWETQLIPGLGRSSGEGNVNPLQDSCLENPMDGEVWQATVHGAAKSWTRLSNFTFFKNRSGFGKAAASLSVSDVPCNKRTELCIFMATTKPRCYLRFSRKSICLKIQERNEYSLLPCYPAIKKLLLEVLNRSLMIGVHVYILIKMQSANLNSKIMSLQGSSVKTKFLNSCLN